MVRQPRFFSNDLQLRAYNQEEALLWLAFRKMVEDAVIPTSSVTCVVPLGLWFVDVCSLTSSCCIFRVVFQDDDERPTNLLELNPDTLTFVTSDRLIVVSRSSTKEAFSVVRFGWYRFCDV